MDDMPVLERIGVACPILGERAAFMEWLSAAGYEPVPMLDLDLLARELSSRPVEALIADVSLVSVADLPRLIRLLGANRPLIVVGEAEGRPARRSPRKAVPRLQSQIDGVSAKIMDVSIEGVRLEVSGTAAPALPPFFTLRVPAFGVTAKVKRVWVAVPNQGALWCGGIIDRGQPVKTEIAWSRFIQTAPTISGELTLRPSN